MTKIQLIDLLKDYLGGGDISAAELSKYHPRILEQFINMGYDRIMWEDYQLSEKKNDFSILDGYLKAFSNVPVLYDSTRGEHYSDLQAPIANVPLQRAIRMVTAQKDQTYIFYYRSNNSSFIFDDLEVGQIDNAGRFYIEEDRIYFPNISEFITKVLIKQIVSMTNIDMDEEVNMPAGSESRIIDYIMKYLINKNAKKEDVVNDNNTTAV